MKAKSIQGENIAKFISSLQQAKKDGFKPNLAFIYASVQFDWQALLQSLEAEEITIFALSSSGEICNDDVVEKSAVGMLLQINPSHFYILEDEKSESENYYDLGARLTLKIKDKFENFGIVVHSGGLMNDGEAIVNGIRSITPDVRLCGGLAGDDFLMKETFVYSNGKYIKSGISLLAFDLAHISFGSLATSG